MNRQCIRLEVSGLVQGVGFRPHSAKLAHEVGVHGWVCNSDVGVTLEVEGAVESVERYVAALADTLPALARVDDMQISKQRVVEYTEFEIRDSAVSRHAGSALVTPDAATCEDCLLEMGDKNNRRYRHPFICCTHCGPRYSVAKALPYDRSRTTLAQFQMCEHCQAEYTNPHDRRFHAQAICCSHCGPSVRLLNRKLEESAEGEAALLQAVNAIRNGLIVAVKGLGGFQLFVDARNEDAVCELRTRKCRPAKPFAIMLSAVSDIEHCCAISSQERRLLQSTQAPIVLLQRVLSATQTMSYHRAEPIAPSVAIDSSMMGCMLPNTPVHHLLMQELGFPVVATSGNPAGQPLVSDEQDLHTIAEVADLFLVHDRPIACALDDSVVRVVADRPMLVRAARGYTPITLPTLTDEGCAQHRQGVASGTAMLSSDTASVLALGGQQKSTIASVDTQRITLGPYRGDLESVESRQAYNTGLDNFIQLHSIEPQSVACDQHPDYYTTHIATTFGIPAVNVQHHLAHIIACMSDNALDGRVLGVAWDGTGFDTDGVIRGGEFIVVDGIDVLNVASLRTFALPGGEQSIKEPRRSALGALYGLFGNSVFTRSDIACVSQFTTFELEILAQMLCNGIRSPRTSSAGRLFDVLASLLGLVERCTFEGEAAMALEGAAMLARSDVGAISDTRYALVSRGAGEKSLGCINVRAQAPGVLDWQPLLLAVLDDLDHRIPRTHIAMKIHTAMANAIVEIARQTGVTKVVLCGGCFQNKILTELAIQGLEDSGFSAYWHNSLPANDGSLSVGQAVWAQRCQASIYRKQEATCA